MKTKSNIYSIELGHSGIKTCYNSKTSYYPTSEPAPYDIEKYINFYKNRAEAIKDALIADKVVNKDIDLRVVVPRYIRAENVDVIEKIFNDMRLDGKALDYNILFVAQEQGAYIKHLIDCNYTAKDLQNSGYRVVVDLGFNQTQVIVFDRGNEVKELYYRTDWGVENLIFKLQTEAMNYLNKHISFDEAVNILKKYKSLDDEVFAYIDSVKDAIEKFLNYLFTYQLDINTIELMKNVTLLTGGGAEIIDYHTFKKYTENDIGFTVDEPFFADVIGAFSAEKFTALLEKSKSN